MEVALEVAVEVAVEVAAEVAVEVAALAPTDLSDAVITSSKSRRKLHQPPRRI